MADLGDLITEFHLELEQRRQIKFEAGEQKYGPGTWLDVDNIEHALDEIVDLMNYIGFLYIQLRLVQLGLARMNNGATAQALPGKENIGKDAIFNPYKRVVE